VIDIVGEGLRAVADRTPVAYPLVFAAGAATSIGPCAAPRYIAVAALVSATRSPAHIVAAFVAGLASAYVLLGTAAGLLGAVWSRSWILYAALACVLGAGGVITLFGGRRPCQPCEGANAANAFEASACASQGRAGLGGAFLLGAGSALVVSPCCTPVVAGIAGLTAASGHTAAGVLLLATFACGHAIPVVAAGALGSRIASALRRIVASHAPAVVSGTLMIALAAFYGLLA
jgi:thiol:disulfide interchange protein DsbD